MKQFKMNERQRFSIRKFSIGAASVLLGSVFFVANPATEVQAAESSTEVIAQDRDVKPDNSSALSSSETSSQNPSVGQAGTEAETQGREKKEPGTSSKDGEAKAKVEERSTEGNSKLESSKEIAEKQDQPKTDIELSRQLNTQNLESLLSEIDAIKTENYTEESVAALKAKAEKARQVLATAQNQTEIDAAFRTLVSYKNTGLRRVKKDVEHKAPKLDTTNGKATVGLKAGNTEPNGTNIAGHNHSLNDINLPEGSGFREANTPEDTNVTIGLEEKGTISDSVVRVTQGNQNFVDRNLKVTAISTDSPITDFTIEGNAGFPLTPKKSGLNTNRASVAFEGNTPASGNWTIKVTAKTNTGTKSFTFGYITQLPKPVIETTNTELSGKSKEKPDVKIKTVTPPPPAPNNEYKLRVYLIRGGADLSAYGLQSQGAYPENYHIIASKDVGSDGTATITSTDYIDSAIGEGEVKAIAVIELAKKPNDSNVGERGSFISDTRRVTAATVPVNKQALQDLVNGAEAKRKTHEYYNAEQGKKTAYDEAITKAAEVLKKANVTQDEINTEKGKVEAALQGLQGAETNKQALQDLVNGAEAKRKTHEYYNAEQGKKTAYDEAITKAAEVLKKANVTQDEINTEKGKVEAAKTGLDGQATNTQELQALVDEAANTALSYKYHNADKDKKDAFDKAIEKAKAVLDDLYASQKAVDEARDNLKLAKESLNGIYIPPYTPQADQPQPSTPTQPDQGATETPTVPSEPAPQPSQPTAPGQSASPAPAPSSAPTQAPRAAASPSASSTSTQVPAPAQEQVDKSELRALTQELDQRLKALATVSDPKIDAAKAVFLDAQKALEDSALTEQGLRTAVESVKAALNSLKDVKANASDSKPAQDKKDAKQGTEDSKDSDKMTETNSVPAGVIVVGLLALLGVIAFWLVRRKKESEIQQLSTELTKVLGQLDAEKADKKVLAKAKKLLQETLDFVKEENGSAETEAKLVEELKAILAKLK